MYSASWSNALSAAWGWLLLGAVPLGIFEEGHAGAFASADEQFDGADPERDDRDPFLVVGRDDRAAEAFALS